MIHLTAAERSRLYLAMRDALDIDPGPDKSADQAQKVALCDIVCGFLGDEGDFALHEVTRLADALEYHLVENTETCGPYGFNLANIAHMVGENKPVARAALRLLGAFPSRDPDAETDFVTGPGNVEKVRFLKNTLIEQIELELDEARGFASQMN